jgi:hypothetical protein
MAVDVRLEGGPKNGYEGRIDDENHLAVLFPGYTPVKAENDPDRGLVMLAQWNGDETQAASYDGVLNVAQENSAYDHPDDQGAATEETDQTDPADAEQASGGEQQADPEGASQEQSSGDVPPVQAAPEASQE